MPSKTRKERAAVVAKAAPSAEDIRRQVRALNAGNAARNFLIAYNNTGNGRFIWQAFLELYRRDQPVPSNILAKFAEWAPSVVALSDAREIARALELSSDKEQKGQHGAARAASYERAWRLASKVNLLREDDPALTKTKAMEIVARDEGVSFSTVKEAHRATFPAKSRNR